MLSICCKMQNFFRHLRHQRIVCLWRLIFAVCLLASLLLLGNPLWLTRAHKRSAVSIRPEPKLTIAERQGFARRFPLPIHQADPLGHSPVVKKIHFMYKSYMVDTKFKSLLSSWRAVYPDYRMYFWTDAEIDLLISRRYRTWQDMYYKQLSNYMERSDTARAFVLHAMGGWYADLDTGCLSRADLHTSRHALILPLEPYLHALNSFHMPRLVSNAIMYSVAEHPFWLFYLHRLNQTLIGQKPRQSTLQAVFVTGPVPLTDAALMFQQAHNGHGCPGLWCPHLPPPVQFLPVYDENSVELRHHFRYLCSRIGTERLFDSIEFEDECRRFKRQDFNNYPLDPKRSFTYHLFLHLNERKIYIDSKIDVRKSFLRLVYGQELMDEISRL